MQNQPDPWPTARYVVEGIAWLVAGGALAACWWGLTLFAR